MRFGALTLITIAALTASIETAAARINCGPGMNSDGYRCFPIINCGPGMNSDGHRCFPIGERYRQDYGGGGYYRQGYGGGYGYGPGYEPGYRPGYGTYNIPGGYNRRDQRALNPGRDCYNTPYGRICCPKGWTVQGGACKPYRGY